MPKERTSPSEKPRCCSPFHASRKLRACAGSTLRPRLQALFTAGILLIALALAACSGGSGSTSDAPADQPPAAGLTGAERVTYQAEDGLRIVADFYAPTGGRTAPVIVLLHQFNGSRAQWADLIPDLLEWGYAVLAPDLRSFGESTVITRGGSDETYELTNLDDMVMDVAAAIEYLKTRGEADAGAIGVVGASVGANLAYVASGAFPEVQATVSMSPNASPSGGALLGGNVPDFSPRAVLLMSDVAEAPDAESLAESVGEPVSTIRYGGGTAHGVQLLAIPQVKSDIRDWLERMLPPVATPTAGFGTPVSYSSEDIEDIMAGFVAPTEKEDPPVIILLHQFGEDGSQWASLATQLLESGYAVLAPDLRSLGDVIEQCPFIAEDRCFDDLLRDIIAAVTYLQAREDVDGERIAVIGASLGGNLAYVSSGAFEALDTAVVTSPNAAPRNGALLGQDIPGFTPRSVLFISGESEAADARTLAANVAEPVEVKVYEGVTAHGVQLLTNPQAVQDILDWLRATL